MKLSTELEKKYPELSEFNKKAMACNDINDFTEVTDSFGIKFSSNESKKALFEQLKKVSEINPAVNGELDDDALEAVNGGIAKTTQTAITAVLALCPPPVFLVTAIVAKSAPTAKMYKKHYKDGAS